MGKKLKFLVCVCVFALIFEMATPVTFVEAKCKTTYIKKKTKAKKKTKKAKKKTKKSKTTTKNKKVRPVPYYMRTPEISRLSLSSKKPGVMSATSVLYTNTELVYLTCIVQAESGNQPFKGQVAVADVVLNRVNSPLFPDTIYDVIYQNSGVPQFSPTADGAMARMLRNYSQNSPQTQQCRRAAIAALTGSSYVGKKLFFHVYRENSSTDRQILNSGRGELIGAHLFY